MKFNTKIFLMLLTGFAIGLLTGFFTWGFKSARSEKEEGSLKRMISNAPVSQGAAYEIFAICPRGPWTEPGGIGDTIQAIFNAPVGMLNQYEALFTLYYVRPEGINRNISQHRNLLEVKLDQNAAEASTRVQYDVNAAPQVIVTVTGPTYKSMTEYLWKHRAELVQVFENAERDRDVATIRRHREQTIGTLIENKFGFKMDIPRGYTVRNEQDHFLWLSLERPVVSQGVVIYDYPYSGRQDFDSLHLTLRRNEFVARIPGPVPDSHMTTYTQETDLYPSAVYTKINGRNWVKMSGFWDVEGDFMGGPFVNYSTLDAATGRIVAIDCYLYSPKYPKRNYLRQLEHLIYCVSFPG